MTREMLYAKNYFAAAAVVAVVVVVISLVIYVTNLKPFLKVHLKASR